jgi:hypothetical protein
MLEVFAGKVRKTGFFQKAGFSGNSDRNFGIYYKPANEIKQRIQDVNGVSVVLMKVENFIRSEHLEK